MSTAAAPGSTAPASPEPFGPVLVMLEGVLAVQLERHQRLREGLEQKRQAIRTADLTRLQQACRREQQMVEGLEDIDQKRRQIVERLSAEIDPGAETPLTIQQLAAHAVEPTRTRLLDTADALRSVAAEVRRESSVMRSAAEALSRHLGGLMQSMRAALSTAGVYGQRGQIDGQQVDFAMLDIRS